ncbi:MAG: glycosyltransferase [Chitinophagaceae bacterium]|nr:MAG: glycosyltransferase [Chitinophagaceae bacterium]
MNTLFIISGLLLSGYVLLLIYYSISWHQMRPFTSQATTEWVNRSLTISIIIPARNEEKNLPALLHSIQNQSYPSALLEVILVDDHSTDATAEVVSQFPFVRYIALQDFVQDPINSYKKKAIEIGIQHSKGTLIVTTDADCFAPKDWLQTIASFYQTYQPELIVMPVAINCGPKAIEIFQALDFMSLQGVTAASVYKNVHSMCNGANLAYSRKAFEAVNGFAGIDTIASGDDMLLMHKIAKKFPGGIRYLPSKSVIVQTEPVHSIGAFLNQRIRWASKADAYDDKRIFVVLIWVYLLNLALLVLPLISIIVGKGQFLKYALVLIAVKTFFELVFLSPVAGFFGKQRMLWLFPLAQPFHILYTVLAGFLGKFGSYQWKERTVK